MEIEIIDRTLAGQEDLKRIFPNARMHFKGGSSTTVTNSYTPSEEEKRLTGLAADYSEAVMPNALALNDYAMNLLKDSMGTVQVDYDTLNKAAQNQIANATSGMSSLIGTNNDALNTANASLSKLANGELSDTYQKNMENSISSALTNTLGQSITNLGNRGVLNSSVTSNALNDIEKNAANSVAEQYQSNLNTAANLATQQYNNAANTSSANSGLYSNLLNTASTPISTAAAAQEAAITPAQSLWNTSLGLDGATTGALAAQAGKGTSTQTTTTSGGSSGLWGNIIGGGLGLAGSIIACFPEGTKVNMADGTTKDIKHIEVGDEVETASGETHTVTTKMQPHYNNVYNIICEDGHTSTTLTQPLMQENGDYILAGDLKIGTELKNVGKVQSIVYSGERKVYDMEVEGDNSYIADGFIAKGGSKDIWEVQ